MRVFVTGASGAIGGRLVPQLIERGHEVVGTHRSARGAVRLRARGAEPVALDLVDAEAVRRVVLEAMPDAIVHEATALSNVSDLRNFDRTFAATNRLGSKAPTPCWRRHARRGSARFVAQSFASVQYARMGGMVKTEEDALDSDPLPTMRESRRRDAASR